MNRYIEIGPGKRPISDEWDTLNIVKPATYVADITQIPLPVPRKRYDLIYAAHVLEHAPWFQTVDVLREWREILAPKGRLEVWVPDFGKILDAIEDKADYREDNWWKHNPDKDLMTWVNGRIFTYGPDPNWHRAVFTADHLERCLVKAGFTKIRPLDTPRTSGHKWINLGMEAIR